MLGNHPSRNNSSSSKKLSFTMAEPVAVVNVDQEYLKEIEMARRQLRAFIATNECAPLMLRLAWNDAATYNVGTRTGGPNGSIRTEKELKQEANKGLEKATQLCEKVKANLKKVTYADLYQLAGVVAIEVSGGPTIEFIPGRKDSNEPSTQSSTPEILQNIQQGAWSLRSIFSRMGISDDKDIVALCGGLIWADIDRPDSKVQWPKNPLKFDNSYYEKILRKDPILRFPNPMEKENALLDDPNFRFYVEGYSKDEDRFFKDYAMSHKKFSELGCNLKKINQNRRIIGIGLISVMTVILGYLFKKKKNQSKK